METNNYSEDIVKRTIELLQTRFDDIAQQDELEVTFLMNCLLGLIVTVVENKKERKQLFTGTVDAELVGFFSEIKMLENKQLVNVDCQTPKLLKYGKLQFMKNIRHAIAHQNIVPINNDKRWTGVKMWNSPYPYMEKDKNFEIEITVEKLKDLAIKVATDFLALKMAQKH